MTDELGADVAGCRAAVAERYDGKKLEGNDGCLYKRRAIIEVWGTLGTVDLVFFEDKGRAIVDYKTDCCCKTIKQVEYIREEVQNYERGYLSC